MRFQLDAAVLERIRDEAAEFLDQHADLKLVAVESTARSLQVKGRLKFVSVWWDFDFDARVDVGKSRVVLDEMDVSARYVIAGAFASAFVLPSVIEEFVRRLRRAKVKGVSFRQDRLILEYAPFLRSLLALGRPRRGKT